MSTQITLPQTEKKEALATVSEDTGIGLHSIKAFELLQRVGKMFATCALVPDTYKDNLPSCCIAVMMANRMGADPLAVMQNLYVVHGRPAWSAKFLIASFNMAGGFTKLRYEWRGVEGKPEYGCRAYCTEIATGDVLHGPWITWKMVKDEKWDAKNGSKWLTIPELMFMYRAGAWFVNTHCPEITMGFRTAEEEEDIITEKDVTGSITELGRTTNFPPPSNIPVDPATAENKPETEPEKPRDEPINPTDATTAQAATGAATATTQAETKPSTKKKDTPKFGDSEPDPFKSGEIK
jgi:hypothetical protein